MLTRDEQVRCAHAAIALRPDWTLQQVLAVLSDDRVAARPYPHVVVALAWVAADDDTRAPGRLFARGDWWDSQGKGRLVDAATPTPRTVTTDDCRECFRPKDDHGIDPTLADHAFEPWHSARPTQLPTDVRAALDTLRPPAHDTDSTDESEQ